MEKTALKTYLSGKYQGWDSFCETIVLPIFGKDDYEDKRKKEVLDMKPERCLLADATGIKSVKFCAQTYVSGEPLQFFDITVSDKVLMDRNRVNVQKIIRSVMDQYSSAFMIFHYEDESKWEWRFSFCYKSENEDESTDRKRYTFLLGPGQSCRTAAENFMALYDKQQKDEDIELDDLINAFNVEALSNEFFNGYKEIYEDIIEYVTGKRMVKVANKWEEKVIREPNEEIMCGFARFLDPEKAVRDYVKKLMGRLVFLQFLQKKGWLGVKVNERWGEGSPTFIKDLFDQTEDKDNFIDNMLEALFNDLNTERTNDLVSSVIGDGIRVPYLNGGLFERDAADEARFPLPAVFMERLLFFFSCYNFTIDENDPNDAEVGVDPEMLGRIFENLLEDNKDKGAYYTPKEIVTYMCRESLIAYLQTDIKEDNIKESIRLFVTNHERNDLLPTDIDKKLCNVKICDPAIGSGAFPMGLLKELFLCRTALEGTEQRTSAEIKKHIIQNNIYGVDIEKGAVDIARLRFWLSLIVDEQTPQALPNLDYKIVEGNSLITTFDGQYIDLSTNIGINRLRRYSLVNIRPEKNALQEEQKRFFMLNGDEKYRSEIAIKNHILNIIWYQLDYEKHSWQDSTIGQAGLFGTTISKGRKKNAELVIEFTQERQAVLDKCEKFISELNDDSKSLQERAGINIPFFEWKTVFSDVLEDKNHKGFDIVIGNPPYVEAKKLKYIANTLKDLYDVYSGTADLSIYFVELGYKILSPNGILNFITTNKFFNTGYGVKLRQLLTSNLIHKIVNFEQVEVFEDILVSSVIIEFEKTDSLRGNILTYEKFYKLKKEQFIQEFVTRQSSFGSYPQDYLDEKEWSFSDLSGLLLKTKIENGSQNLSLLEGVSINRGVTTGYNPAFIIDDEKKNELILDDSNNNRIIKNMLQGRNIRKWYYNESDENLIFTRRGVNIDNYPCVKEYLNQFYANLKPKTNSDEEYGRKPGSYKWYEILDNTAYYKEFERDEKIIWGLTADKWAFTIDTGKHYLPSNAYILTSTDLSIKYILGLLNSKLMHYYFHFIGVMTAGGAYTLKGTSISALPFKISDNPQRIADVVDEILSIKAKNHDVDVSNLESKINSMVYELYGLSESDILLVEEFVKQQN